jgi:hypothetical protein
MPKTMLRLSGGKDSGIGENVKKGRGIFLGKIWGRPKEGKTF